VQRELGLQRLGDRYLRAPLLRHAGRLPRVARPSVRSAMGQAHRVALRVVWFWAGCAPLVDLPKRAGRQQGIRRPART
jgi:hypothetical protein